MKDYLGADQRKVTKDNKDEDKPIQGKQTKQKYLYRQTFNKSCFNIYVKFALS